MPSCEIKDKAGRSTTFYRSRLPDIHILMREGRVQVRFRLERGREVPYPSWETLEMF